MATDIRTCADSGKFNTGNSKCPLIPGKVKAIILVSSGHKLPNPLTAESLEIACHADRPDRIFPIKEIIEFAPSGGEAQTSATGYGPNQITGYAPFIPSWTLLQPDLGLKANLMKIKNTAMDAYFVDEDNVIFGVDDGSGSLAGIPLAGLYVGGQDWAASGGTANMTITTIFKDYEKYIKTQDFKVADFDVVNALNGLVFVEFKEGSAANKYKLVEYYGGLDVTGNFGELIADNASSALPDATGVSYADGEITATGTVSLAKPSVLQTVGILGIEQYS